MSDFDGEPVRGLPAPIPPGERILWQGAPDWRALARTALALPWVAGYFAVLVVIGLTTGSLPGTALTVFAGVLCLALLAGIAWASARSTLYTLTNRRLVLRIGIAFTKHVNLPLNLIGAADLRMLNGDKGDIALTMTVPAGIPYLMLWPHARPRNFRNPQPMLRAVPDAAAFAALLARTCAAVTPLERGVIETQRAVPAAIEGVAA